MEMATTPTQFPEPSEMARSLTQHENKPDQTVHQTSLVPLHTQISTSLT